MSREPVGILLAAGRSSRFGSHKLTHKLPGTQTPIAVQAASHLLAAVPNSVAVVRDGDQQLIELLSETGIDIATNNHADLGISRSLCCGISTRSEAFAWVVALADMPFVPPRIIEQVSRALKKGALLAAPEYNGQRGHPVGFSHKLMKELLQLQGDVGAKTIVDKHRNDLQLIQVTDKAILRDIDKTGDLHE